MLEPICPAAYYTTLLFMVARVSDLFLAKQGYQTASVERCFILFSMLGCVVKISINF